MVDTPPPWLRLAGLSAFDRREPSVRVAHLEMDTLLPQSQDPGTPRLLRFRADRQLVLMTVTERSHSVTLAIALTPRRRVRIEVRPLHGNVRHVWADARGIAECRAVPHGPVSLLVHWPETADGPLRTAWTQV